MGNSTQSSGGGRRGSRPRKTIGAAIGGAIVTAGEATGFRTVNQAERARKRADDDYRGAVVNRRRVLRKLFRRRS